MKVIIVGAGASGMMAAISAARAQAEVILLEKEKKPGKKLAITGNGKCNFSNSNLSESFYRGKNPGFVNTGLNHFGLAETLDFFQEIGIYPKNREGGFYPYSDQATQVVQILVNEMQKYKIKCKYDQEVTEIKKENSCFYVTANGWTYEADACIIATGSPAGQENEKEIKEGRSFAKKFGHPVEPLFPVLTGIKTKGSFFAKMAGVRMLGEVSVICEGTMIDSCKGELQFTNYGISGIPVFQVSHKAIEAYIAKKKVQIRVSFFPEFTKDSLRQMLESRAENLKQLTCNYFLTGFLPQKCVDLINDKLQLNGKKIISELKPDTYEELIQLLCNLTEEMSGYMDFSHAQACAGGINTDYIDAKTMESKLIPDLYFAGEVMDIDGLCGGYNLQWAWTSGFLAGKHAAKQGI